MCIIGPLCVKAWFFVNDDDRSVCRLFFDKVMRKYPLLKNFPTYGDASEKMFFGIIVMVGSLFLGILLWNYIAPVVLVVLFLYLLRYARRWQRKVDKVIGKEEGK
jgi:hypothetical protein